MKKQLHKKSGLVKGIASSVMVWLAAGALAQPALQSADLHTGLSFNLYSLSGVNGTALQTSGANVTWNLGTVTATLAGTAGFYDMNSTPYASQYPNANFAIGFTAIGSGTVYSLFNFTPTILEEVANNVGGNTQNFTNYRTALVFPYTFNLSITDNYQKSGQSATTVQHTYDAYGTLSVNSSNYTNLVRDFTNDIGAGSQQGIWHNVSPIYPVLQADNSGVTLWELTTNGIDPLTKQNSFQVYPNPATNVIHIVNQKPIQKIEIYSALGQLQLSATESVIDVQQLPAGAYYIKAYLGQTIETSSFIKQ